MKLRKKSKYTIFTASALIILLVTGAVSIGAYAQSYYRDFYAGTTEDKEQYEISGTLYQNVDPRSLTRFEKSPDTILTVKGTMTPIQGEIKLIYKDEDGILVTLAEAKAGSEEPVSISYEINSTQQGEFYFDGNTAVCEFDISFSKSEGVIYYLTSENPISTAY